MIWSLSSSLSHFTYTEARGLGLFILPHLINYTLFNRIVCRLTRGLDLKRPDGAGVSEAVARSGRSIFRPVNLFNSSLDAWH